MISFWTPPLFAFILNFSSSLFSCKCKYSGIIIGGLLPWFPWCPTPSSDLIQSNLSTSSPLTPLSKGDHFDIEWEFSIRAWIHFRKFVQIKCSHIINQIPPLDAQPNEMDDWLKHAKPPWSYLKVIASNTWILSRLIGEVVIACTHTLPLRPKMLLVVRPRFIKLGWGLFLEEEKKDW